MDSAKNVFSDLSMQRTSGVPLAKYWSQSSYSYARFEGFSKLRDQLKAGIPYGDSLTEYSAIEFSKIAQQLLAVFQQQPAMEK